MSNTVNKMSSYIHNEDINDSNINSLYDMAKGIDDYIKNAIAKGDKDLLEFSTCGLLDMVVPLEDFKILNSVQTDCNKFYADLFDDDPDGSYPIIDVKSQYTGVKDEKNEEEIVANQVFVANRLAKMAKAIREKITGKLSDSDKIILKKLNTKWTANTMANSWDFMDSQSIEFKANNSNLKNYNISSRGIKFKGNVNDYNNFENWFVTELNNVSSKKGTNLSVKDIPLFQEYSRLVYCEDIFYNAKQIAINKCIDLDKNTNSSKIKVSDASLYDDLDDENKMLIQIDLPNYSAPILVHAIKDNISAKLPQPDSRFKYNDKPILPFRMTEDQIKYIASRDAVKLWGNNAKKYEDSADKLEYMQNTVNWGKVIGKKGKIINDIEKNKKNMDMAKDKNNILTKKKEELQNSLNQIEPEQKDK